MSVNNADVEGHDSAESTLRSHAVAIWKAGVAAVAPDRLFASKVSVDVATSRLRLDEQEIDLSEFKRIVVVGAGKATAAMAIAFEQQVVPKLKELPRPISCTGWVNVPSGSFEPTEQAGDIYLHVARPAGINQPTIEAIAGTRQILQLVSDCHDDDLVICLLSGGGSALLVAPPSGITLEDKQAVAQVVAAAGANIEQLNTIRRCLSQIKGGGLARLCNARRLVTLAISDVLGDPIETIASGPTVADIQPDPTAALHALHELGLSGDVRMQSVVRYLESQVEQPPANQGARANCDYVILGNNADAVDAAGAKAVELGYQYLMESATEAEGDVMLLADAASRTVRELARGGEVDCWISGGEPSVRLPADPGKGGRNQQLALAVMQRLSELNWPDAEELRELVFLSGGTDGEDGPTPVAGALFDVEVWQLANRLQLKPPDFLARADAYNFFEQTNGLLSIGPTGTNVCDLRVTLLGSPRLS